MSVLKWARLGLATVVVTALTGCAVMAPPYQASVGNAEAAKQFPQALVVGMFSVQPGLDATSISLRGNPMKSPVGADYAAYLADALRKELTLAGKLDPSSRVEISGVLLKNDISAGGISTNSGVMQVRFTVKRDAALRYERTLDADLSWESSFVGAIAVPKAQEAYPRMVQKLIGTLFADPAFLAALK